MIMKTIKNDVMVALKPLLKKLSRYTAVSLPKRKLMNGYKSLLKEKLSGNEKHRAMTAKPTEQIPIFFLMLLTMYMKLISLSREDDESEWRGCFWQNLL